MLKLYLVFVSKPCTVSLVIFEQAFINGSPTFLIDALFWYNNYTIKNRTWCTKNVSVTRAFQRQIGKFQTATNKHLSLISAFKAFTFGWKKDSNFVCFGWKETSQKIIFIYLNIGNNRNHSKCWTFKWQWNWTWVPSIMVLVKKFITSISFSGKRH